MSEQKYDGTKPTKQESSQMFRNKMILETSIDGFCMIDLEGNLIEANSSLCTITGYSREDLLKMKISDLDFGETEEQARQHIEKVTKQGSDRFETKHRRKDGEIIDIEVRTQFYGFGKDQFLFSFFRDLTQRKQNEDKLRMLINAVDHCGSGIATVNMEGITQYVNKTFAEMHGYTPAEVLGKHISIFHSPEQMSAVSAVNQQIISTGSFIGEIWHSRRDGTVFLGQMNNVILRDNSGDPVGIIGTLQDITAIKKAGEDLYKSEELLSAIIESSADCIIVWDRNYNYLYANKNAIEHVGTTRDKVIGKNITDGLGHIPDFMHLWMERIDQVFETGIPMQVEDCMLVGERYVYSESNVSPIKDKKGDMFAVGVAYRDVSEQKRLEIEREGYKENILNAHRHAYIGSMGAIVAHQVNQPLTMINILLDRAIEQIKEKSYSPAILKNIKDGLAEAQKAAEIIRKFRQCSNYSSMEAAGGVNVADVTDRIISVLSEKARQAKISILKKDMKDLPEVEINETALEQIFLIIIQNAIEAANDHQLHKLDITGKFADGNIELQFADDCCGIAPENIDKIFESFFSTKTEGSGMGLGLDIVQQILISFGGQIRVESQLGKGTTFYITLPINNILRT